MADAFHQTAVASDHISVVIDKIVTKFSRQMAFGHGHANSIGNALAKRASGCFNAACMAKFRMPSGACAKLSEIADFINRHIGIAGQVKQRI